MLVTEDGHTLEAELASADDAGGAWVSYNSPDFLAARHHLSDELRARLQGVEAIASATVAP